MRMFACALYVGMLLLAPIAVCDIVIPVFDCVKESSRGTQLSCVWASAAPLEVSQLSMHHS